MGYNMNALFIDGRAELHHAGVELALCRHLCQHKLFVDLILYVPLLFLQGANEYSRVVQDLVKLLD